MGDDLIRLRAFYYTQNFNSAIEEYSSVKAELVDSSSQAEAEWFYCRSLLGLKQYTVEAILSCKNKGIQLLASYFQQKLENITFDKSNIDSCIAAAQIFYMEGQFEQSFDAVSDLKTEEALALKIYIYLKLHRQDLAEKELYQLRSQSNDSVLSQICEAVLQLSLSGDGYQQAYYAFAEMADGYGRSSFCVIGQAVCCMHLGKMSEAESLLGELSKFEPNNRDALANLITAAVLSGRSGDVVAKMTTNLFALTPKHLFVSEWEAKSQLFDKCAEKYLKNL